MPRHLAAAGVWWVFATHIQSDVAYIRTDVNLDNILITGRLQRGPRGCRRDRGVAEGTHDVPVSRRSLAADAGRLLRTTREVRGLSQARLAGRAGISQQRLSKLERGVADPRLGDLERLFAGLRLRPRLEVAPAAAAAEDPDLLLDVPEEERLEGVAFHCRFLDRFGDVPHVVGGRLAALAHGLPVRVHRLDLLVTHDDRPLLARALRRFSVVRWSERWQEFCDQVPPERPGPMRWLISGIWELRVALVDDLPDRVAARLGDRELRVPSFPWLETNDSDVADLRDRLTALGRHQPGGWPGAG